MNIERQRADFEAYARTRNYDLDAVMLLSKPPKFSRYANPATQDAFEAYQAGRAALQSQDREDTTADAMSAVADRYAHILALHLECVLLNYSGPFWDTAAQTLSEYRSAMDAIHESESPTYMGEPIIDHARRVEGGGE